MCVVHAEELEGGKGLSLVFSEAKVRAYVIAAINFLQVDMSCLIAIFGWPL